jgi:hypothetical protein
MNERSNMAVLTIFKYQIHPLDNQIIEIPKGGKVLSFKVKGNKMFIWVLLHPEHTLEKRYFKIFGTGDKINQEFPATYIGTACMGDYVWHLFEENRGVA